MHDEEFLASLKQQTEAFLREHPNPSDDEMFKLIEDTNERWLSAKRAERLRAAGAAPESALRPGGRDVLSVRRPLEGLWPIR